MEITYPHSSKDCYNLREELYEIFELEGISKEDAKEKNR